MGEKIFRKEDFPDLLEEISLSSKMIIKQIEYYHLECTGKKNSQEIWQMQLPLFVPTFYDFILKYGRVPRQNEFFEYYLALNCSFFSSNNFDRHLLSGVMTRLFLSYPSIVREICFNKYVKEHIVGYNVIYNVDLDVKEGIDLMLSKGEKHFALNLYHRPNGQEIEYNNTYHIPFVNVEYIDLPVEDYDSFVIGEFNLFWSKEFDLLLTILK